MDVENPEKFRMVSGCTMNTKPKVGIGKQLIWSREACWPRRQNSQPPLIARSWGNLQLVYITKLNVAHQQFKQNKKQQMDASRGQKMDNIFPLSRFGCKGMATRLHPVVLFSEHLPSMLSSLNNTTAASAMAAEAEGSPLTSRDNTSAASHHAC